MFDDEIPFSEKSAANLMRKILRGLAYIHTSGYMHRDIKLENIMVTMQVENGKLISLEPSLTDFGMAKQFKEGERETQCLGTPLYMAPELLQTKSYDKKVDIWAIGILTYILLTGNPPYESNSLSGLLRQ